MKKNKMILLCALLVSSFGFNTTVSAATDGNLTMDFGVHTDDSVALVLSSDTDGEKCEIYRSDDNDNYEVIAEVDCNSTYYDSDVDIEATYYYATTYSGTYDYTEVICITLIECLDDVVIPNDEDEDDDVVTDDDEEDDEIVTDTTEDDDTTENPQTGINLPVSSLAVLIIAGLLMIKMTKKKSLIRNI